MPRQRLLLFASWIVTTLSAALVSAAGVSIVTRDVTDSHTPALRSTDVIALLAAPTGATTPPPSELATTTPSLPPSTAPVPPTSDTAAPAITDPPPTTSRPPTTKPATSSPPLGAALAETYWSHGGSMTVACFGDTIALVSARPHDGYRFVVDQDGPDRVHVRFEADDDRDGLAAACRDGAPIETAGDRGGGWGGDEPEPDAGKDDGRGRGGQDGQHDGGDDSGSGDDGARRGGR